jgi:Raf kinase inhibitor-like YbhB/YbcL family protein
MNNAARCFVLGLFALGAGCAKTSAAMPSLSVSSTAFNNGELMPARFTCEGNNTSPPIAWSEPPAGTQSLALIIDDPDAPDPQAAKRSTFVHWVVYNLSPATRAMSEGTNAAPAGALDGRNDFGNTRYGGPCPPKGRHRYFIKVFALDGRLPDLKQPHALDLEKAMDGHILARGVLMGTYEKGHGAT